MATATGTVTNNCPDPIPVTMTPDQFEVLCEKLDNLIEAINNAFCPDCDADP